MHNMTNIDPIAISFIVFFSLFLGGFLLLICLGCVIHCCCTVDMPTYRAEFSDEAVICERLTKKERIAVIEKAFENYDHRLLSNDIEANRVICVQIGQDDEKSTTSTSSYKKICAICLEDVMPTKTAKNMISSSCPPSFDDDEIYYHNSLTLTSSDDSSHFNQQQQSNASLPHPALSASSSNNNKSNKSNNNKKSAAASSSYLHHKRTSNATTTSDGTNIDKNRLIIQGYQCKHVFHRGCIKPWLEQGKISCPCCRKDIINPNDFKCAVVSVLRKERLQMMQRWGIKQNWVQLDG